MAPDITELLADGLSTLRFPTNDETKVESFEPFSELPTELRLKIICNHKCGKRRTIGFATGTTRDELGKEVLKGLWSHALPIFHTFRLKAKILVADPEFGIYITFFTTLDDGGISWSSSTSPPRRTTYPRSISLLRACRESRDLYLENFPISLPFSIDLPFGMYGQGRLYLSKNEVLHIENLPALIKDGTFKSALKRNYRLQKWWEDIEKLAMDITCLLVSNNDWKAIPLLLEKMPALKELKGVMWGGFQDVVENGTAEGAKTVKGLMNANLITAERELLRCVKEGTGKFAVPEMSLMDWAEA